MRVKRTGTVVTVGAVLGCLLIALAPATSSASPAQDSPRIATLVVDGLSQLESSDPDTFAGVSYDDTAGVATVRYADRADRASTKRRADDAARSRPHGRAWQVNLVPARHSLRELEAVRDRITADRSWVPSGALLSGWFVDVQRNAVLVTAVEVTPALTEAASRTFGDLVELETAPRYTNHSRLKDWEPWAAGAYITNPRGGRCTSGFALRNVSTKDEVLLTAGHCFDTMYEAATQFGVKIGVVDRLDNTRQRGRDYATIHGSTYDGWVYTGNDADSIGQSIDSYSLYSADGISVCTSGAVTKEDCTGRVVGEMGCGNSDDGRVVCGLIRITGSNGRMSQDGDSGGPVYTRVNNQVIARGIIVGSNSTVTVIHPLGEIIPSGYGPMLYGS